MLNNDKWVFVPREQVMTDEELEELYRREMVERDTKGFNWSYLGGLSLMFMACYAGWIALKWVFVMFADLAVKILEKVFG